MASASQQLRNWDISDEDLGQLQKDSTMRHYVTLRAQPNGVVVEKP